jgi:hypothetical protein
VSRPWTEPDFAHARSRRPLPTSPTATQAKSGAAASTTATGVASSQFRCVHGVTRADNGCFVCPQCFHYDVC